MSTVNPEILLEGNDLLQQKNAEDIRKLADRIINVESDNWFALFLRGCANCLELNIDEALTNWGSFLKNKDEGTDLESYRANICEYLAQFILRFDGTSPLNFAALGEFVNQLNDDLPECEGEIIVTPVLEKILEAFRNDVNANPYLTYRVTKALVFCAFRAYVELDILSGFITRLESIGEEISARSEPRIGAAIATDRIFLEEVRAAIDSAITNCPPETLEAIEEYWLEHKTDGYVAQLQQAYQMSEAVVNAGKLTGKILKKTMLMSVQNFIRVYLSAKIQ